MIKITKQQIEKAISFLHHKQNEKYGYDCDSWDYDLSFDKDSGLVEIYVTFSSGDVLDLPLNYKVENNLK